MQLYTVTGIVVYAIVEGKSSTEVNRRQADEFYNSLRVPDKVKYLAP